MDIIALKLAEKYTDKEVEDIMQIISSHINDGDNPHNITKEQIGLGNVDDIQQASKQEFESHKNSNAPHSYGGKFEWRYNSSTGTLDLVVIE